MRQMKVLAYSGLLFLSIFLLAFTALYAQAPAAGTMVSVKMLDTVNSGNDPAGKQYRASVTTGVTAANGVTIAQGAAATVTLTSSGSDYTAQLSSVTIDGQSVAVTSNSATVSAVAQLVQSKAASAVGSVLGGFGHHVSAPASVTAAATGQHVSLPIGTTLNFVLGEPPASNPVAPSAATAQPPSEQPIEASATPAPSPTATQAARPLPARPSTPAMPTPTTATTAYYKECAALFGNRANENCAAAANEYYVYCWSASLDGPVMYFSDVFAFNKDVSSGNLSADLAGPFLQFLEDKHGVKVSSDLYPTSHYTGGSYPTACSSSLTGLSWAQQQKQLTESNVVKSLHKQIVETEWKTSIAPLPPVTAPPAAANEYYVSCYSDTAMPVQYFSEIFAAVPAGDSISNAFLAFLQKKYSFNDTRPGPHVDCDVSAKPVTAYMFKTAWSVRQNREGLADMNKKQSIETGWKYTP